MPPGSELVVASTWGAQFTDFLRGQAGAGAFDLMALAAHTTALNRSFVPEQAERVFIADLHGAQARAGHGTLLALNQESADHRRGARGRRSQGSGVTRTTSATPPTASGAARSTEPPPWWSTAWARPVRWRSTAWRAAGSPSCVATAGAARSGFLYGLVTDLAGFDQVKGEEWKIMGLAPYGRPDPDLVALLARLCTVEGRPPALRR